MAGQLPRPWFRLGSLTRPTTGATTGSGTDQPRPVPARIRPPVIRTASFTEPAEPTTPQPSKSPPQTPMKKAASPPQLPLPGSLTPPVKKPASPPAAAVTRPALPSPAKHISPKGKSGSVVGSPTKNELVNKDSSKQASPVSSPLVPKSIPAVPTPYQSPKPKAAASPPSPLTLPPPQLQSVDEPKHESIPQEVERKTVVFQKVMDKASQGEHDITSYHTHAAEFGQNGKQEPKKSDEDESKDKAIGAKKALLESSNDKDTNTNTRVITMAGKNNGASMEIFLSDKNKNKNEDTTNNNLKDNKSTKKTIRTRNGLPMKAFFNSNVQGINNSILMDSKFTHHDPGIHLMFSPMPPPPSADAEDDKGHQ
ncbi:hypothetical protein SDJN02_23974, partial [Cucurbita argyrosperma subsp. argyrosperma]